MNGLLETLMNATHITVGRMDTTVIFHGVEVTKNFVEFVFENCSEDKAVELANFVTDEREKQLKDKKIIESLTEWIAVVVEHVIVFNIDRGATDEEILSMFDESSKEEVKKRIIAFRK